MLRFTALWPLEDLKLLGYCSTLFSSWCEVFFPGGGEDTVLWCSHKHGSNLVIFGIMNPWEVIVFNDFHQAMH